MALFRGRHPPSTSWPRLRVGDLCVGFFHGGPTRFGRRVGGRIVVDLFAYHATWEGLQTSKWHDNIDTGGCWGKASIRTSRVYLPRSPHILAWRTAQDSMTLIDLREPHVPTSGGRRRGLCCRRSFYRRALIRRSTLAWWACCCLRNDGRFLRNDTLFSTVAWRLGYRIRRIENSGPTYACQVQLHYMLGSVLKPRQPGRPHKETHQGLVSAGAGRRRLSPRPLWHVIITY